MIINLILFSIAIASIGRGWKEILSDFPEFKNAIKRYLPYIFSKPITCSFCFNYWLALIFVICFSPLSGWQFEIAINNEVIKYIVRICLDWVIVAGVSWIVRFPMDELWLFIHMKNHGLKKETGHT